MKALLPISSYILPFAVLAFFLVGFLGLGHTDMVMGPTSQMSVDNCFMPGMTATLCQMNPLEHIATWQNMFTATNLNDIALLLLMLLSLALGVRFICTRKSPAPPLATVLQSQFLYYKRLVPIIYSLQETFSNGILHPKIF